MYAIGGFRVDLLPLVDFEIKWNDTMVVENVSCYLIFLFS